MKLDATEVAPQIIESFLKTSEYECFPFMPILQARRDCTRIRTQS